MLSYNAHHITNALACMQSTHKPNGSKLARIFRCCCSPARWNYIIIIVVARLLCISVCHQANKRNRICITERYHHLFRMRFRGNATRNVQVAHANLAGARDPVIDPLFFKKTNFALSSRCIGLSISPNWDSWKSIVNVTLFVSKCKWTRILVVRIPLFGCIAQCTSTLRFEVIFECLRSMAHNAFQMNQVVANTDGTSAIHAQNGGRKAKQRLSHKAMATPIISYFKCASQSIRVWVENVRHHFQLTVKWTTNQVP